MRDGGGSHLYMDSEKRIQIYAEDNSDYDEAPNELYCDKGFFSSLSLRVGDDWIVESLSTLGDGYYVDSPCWDTGMPTENLLPAGKRAKLQPSFRTKASSTEVDTAGKVGRPTELCRHAFGHLCAAMRDGGGSHLYMDSEKRIQIYAEDNSDYDEAPNELYCDTGFFSSLSLQRVGDDWIVESLSTSSDGYYATSPCDF